MNSIQKAKSSGSFLLKKLISLWIPCVAAFVLFFVFQKIVGIITPAGRYWWQFSAKDWILSGSLVATFVGSYDKINVTWFLIPLIIFFVYNAFVWNSSYSSKIKLFICMGIVIAIYGIGKYMAENKFFFTLGDRAWFITLIVTGVIFALVKNKEISKKEGIIFLSINYILTIVGMYLYSPSYIQGEKYLLSFVYAILIFVAFSKIELKENRIISFISKISFAVYLTHMTFGTLTTGLFEHIFPFAIAVLIGISVSFLAAILLHYSIEVPLKKLLAKI